MEEKFYTIGELADAAEVTPRTIRYYTAEGLLPPPDMRGRYALYNEDHLHRLQLINRLKDAYLPLNEIKTRLEQLTPEQVVDVLAEYKQASMPQMPEDATGYIARVLNSGTVPVSSMQPPPMPVPEQPASAAAPSAPAAQKPGNLFERFLPQRKEQRGIATPEVPQVQADTWQRIPLAPGVELHIKESLSPKFLNRIEQLIAYARDLFKQEE